MSGTTQVRPRQLNRNDHTSINHMLDGADSSFLEDPQTRTNGGLFGSKSSLPFRLSNERYKSKPIMETLNPRWLEQFDLNLFSEQSHEMEITVWDKDQRTKDDFMGR